MNDIKAIKAAAEAATQGDWSIVGTGKCIDIRFGDNCVNQVLVKWTGFEASDLSIKKTRANAKHIATANPATVIALCDEIENLRTALEQPAQKTCGRCVVFCQGGEGCHCNAPQISQRGRERLVSDQLNRRPAVEPVAEVAWDGVNLNTLFIRFLPAGIGLSVGTKLYTPPPPPAEPAVKLYDHGPQAETAAEALRDVSKWLNERPNRPLDLRHVAMLCAALAEPAPVQELDDEPSAQPHKLSEDEYTALAHRIASKYTHRSDPAFTAYTFLPHTLGQFVDAVQSAVWAKLGVEP